MGECMVTYQRFTTRNNRKIYVTNVESDVAVATITRGFNSSDLTGRNLVFWQSASLGEVVAHGGSTVNLELAFYPRNNFWI